MYSLFSSLNLWKEKWSKNIFFDETLDDKLRETMKVEYIPQNNPKKYEIEPKDEIIQISKKSCF